MERLTEKQHLKLNKQEAYRLYMDTLHELALVTNELIDSKLINCGMYELNNSMRTNKKDNLYAF